jgi:hypothetical protein
MAFSKDEVKNLLEFLARKYPETFGSLDKLKKEIPPPVNPDKLYQLVFFCWEAGYINCNPIPQVNPEKFEDIRINSTGIKFLLGF